MRNYIGKHVKNIKRVLGWAEEEGQTVNPAYQGKSFKLHQEQATDVYLTEDELARMRVLDLTPHPKGIALSRDLFMIGCYTGIRVSDYSRLQTDLLHMSKGKRYFVVQMEKKIILLLMNLPMGISQAQSVLYKIAEKTYLDVRFFYFRIFFTFGR